MEVHQMKGEKVAETLTAKRAPAILFNFVKSGFPRFWMNAKLNANTCTWFAFSLWYGETYLYIELLNSNFKPKQSSTNCGLKLTSTAALRKNSFRVTDCAHLQKCCSLSNPRQTFQIERIVLFLYWLQILLWSLQTTSSLPPKFWQ